MDPVASARRDQSSIIEWGAASVALGDPDDAGESGDLHVVVPFSERALVAVIDGLGHGPEAASASGQAAELLATGAQLSLVALVESCHAGLRGTRGAVMSLASFNALDDSMTWIAVGNVETLLLRADPAAGRRQESINARGGVVGYQLPPLRAAVLPVSAGDTLIMATDGIRRGFMTGASIRQRPQDLADAIMAHHRKESDDALVLVARYLGRTS